MNAYYAKLQAKWTLRYDAKVLSFGGLPLRTSDQGLFLSTPPVAPLLDFRHLSTDNFWIRYDARSEHFECHDYNYSSPGPTTRIVFFSQAYQDYCWAGLSHTSIS